MIKPEFLPETEDFIHDLSLLIPLVLRWPLSYGAWASTWLTHPTVIYQVVPAPQGYVGPRPGETLRYQEINKEPYDYNRGRDMLREVYIKCDENTEGHPTERSKRSE